MPLVTLKKILFQARSESRAIGAFNIANFETALAVAMAAEAEMQPVIIQIYRRLMDQPGIEALVAMVLKLAERCPVPVAVHLDHSVSFEEVRKAIDMGFSSVMIDGSVLPLPENIRLVNRVVELASKTGVSVEAEIGAVPLNERNAISLPSSEDVRRFSAQTGVDALAVAVGTVHGYYREAAEIDMELGRRAGEETSIPLVLHGGTGTPDETVGALIRYGFAKVNIATCFQHGFLRYLAAELSAAGDTFVPVDKLMLPVVQASSELVRRYIRKFSSP